jgi:Kef-type K+ transport system membrane component KefB
VKVPSVVLELLGGILIGPQVLALATETPTVAALSSFGLSFLFFMAGHEIESPEIRGRALDLATIGWFVSLLLAFGVAAVLLIIGLTLSELLIALALTTTALGTLLPMLQDADLLHTRFGSYILAIGGAGEFLPIVAIALFLSGDNPVHSTLLLIAFVVLAAAAVAVAVRPTPPRIVELLGRTLDSSSQLPIRIAVLLIALLVWVASELSLDILLGAFVAGLVVRLANKGAQPHVIERKLSSVAFGVFVPVFFIVSGMSFDVDSFRDEPVTLLRVPLSRPVPRHTWNSRSAALSPRPGALRSHPFGAPVCHRAAARRRDHPDRPRHRPDEARECRRARRRGDALGPRVSVRRASATTPTPCS